MSKNIEVIFRNATDQHLHFVINRRFRGVYGLDGVAWQVRGVPAKKDTSPAPTGKVSWTNNYGIAIVEFNDDLQRYTIIQELATAKLGKVYSVTTLDGGIPSIGEVPVGQASSPNEIMIKNMTSPGQKIALGFTLGGKLVGAENDVRSGAWSIFDHTDTCCVTCFSKPVSQGEIIPEVKIGIEDTDSVVCIDNRVVADFSILSPVKLKLQDIKQSHTVEAKTDHTGTVSLTVVA